MSADWNPPHQSGPWNSSRLFAEHRLIRSAIVLKPSTLLTLHRALTQRKYRRLFSSKVPTKPGPKGPTQEVIAAVVDMKRRNPTWGCPRIAQQIAWPSVFPSPRMWCGAFSPFGTNRNQTRRGRPGSPCSVTQRTVCGVSICFDANPAVLRTHWVLVVMDQCTRRIVGFAVHRGVVDGVGLCRMFNRATRGQSSPKYLSSDHDPLYRFRQWQANLRILDVREIKTVPYVPLSHPFVERLIGTIRRECLDRTPFWTAADLEIKLLDFQRHYNARRTHAGLNGRTPEPSTDTACARASVSSYRWQPH